MLSGRAAPHEERADIDHTSVPQASQQAIPSFTKRPSPSMAPRRQSCPCQGASTLHSKEDPRPQLGGNRPKSVSEGLRVRVRELTRDAGLAWLPLTTPQHTGHPLLTRESQRPTTGSLCPGSGSSMDKALSLLRPAPCVLLGTGLCCVPAGLQQGSLWLQNQLLCPLLPLLPLSGFHLTNVHCGI